MECGLCDSVTLMMLVSLFERKTFVFVSLQHDQWRPNEMNRIVIADARVWNAFESQNLTTFQIDQFLFFFCVHPLIHTRTRTILRCWNCRGAHIIHAYALFISSVVYLLILNSLNLLQLSHRTSHASVCKIIHLEHFNRAQNLFVRKRYSMLYLAMKLPEYDRCTAHLRVCARKRRLCVHTWFVREKSEYLKRSKVTNNTSLINDNAKTAPAYKYGKNEYKLVNLW